MEQKVATAPEKSGSLVKPLSSRYIITACSYLFLYLQPDLIQSSLKQISCKTLAGRRWKQSNLLQECDEENLRTSYLIAVPVLVLQLATPIVFLLVVLRKFRSGYAKSKENVSLFNKNFGFFFLDYSDRCYYWEFIRILQMISFISIIIIFDNQLLKGIFILIVTLIYGYYAFRLSPIDNIQIQRMEILSICVQILTILAILVTIDSTYTQMNIGAIVFVILLNFYFLLLISSKLMRYYYYLIVMAIYTHFPASADFFLIRSALETIKKQKIAKQRWFRLRGLFLQVLQDGKNKPKILFAPDNNPPENLAKSGGNTDRSENSRSCNLEESFRDRQ